MLFSQPDKVIIVKDTLALDVSTRQSLIKQPIELSPHPEAERNIESLFRRSQILSRYEITESTLEYPFALTIVKLLREWNPKRQFDYARIQKWNPKLERMSHAHLIGVFEKIVTEERLDIEERIPVALIPGSWDLFEVLLKDSLSRKVSVALVSQ